MARSRRGGAAIEFALTVPVVVVLLGFILDWGFWFEAQSLAQAAARDCARAGAGAPPDTDPVPHARARADALLAAEPGLVRAITRGATPVITVALRGAAPAALVDCTVALPAAPVVGLLAGPVAPPPDATARFALRREVQP
jgi:hypothetical protein